MGGNGTGNLRLSDRRTFLCISIGRSRGWSPQGSEFVFFALLNRNQAAEFRVRFHLAARNHLQVNLLRQFCCLRQCVKRLLYFRLFMSLFPLCRRVGMRIGYG